MGCKTKRSIDVDCPNGDKAEEVVIDIAFRGNTVSIDVPEVSATCLNALPFLAAQDNLHDVFVSVLASFFELILDGIGDVLAGGVEITGRSLLFGYQLLPEHVLYYLPGF